MRITKEMVMAHAPCYSAEQIDDLMAGRKWVGPATVAKLDIPLSDKSRILTKLMTEEHRREFARRCALDVIHMWDAPDVVREYLETGNEELRAAARAEARDTVWSAASDAAQAEALATAQAAALATARSAACDAASYASRSAASAASSDTACAAASYAAGDAAQAAASDAARAAAMKKYISWCVEYLEAT